MPSSGQAGVLALAPRTPLALGCLLSQLPFPTGHSLLGTMLADWKLKTKSQG